MNFSFSFCRLAIEQAVAKASILPSTAENLVRWLTEKPYADFQPDIIQHIQDGRWSELEEAFWTVLPFGTAGRRGRMYPIGCNTINARTVAETILASAEHFEAKYGQTGSRKGCIGFDVRHNSREFAHIACEVLCHRGWHVYLLEEPRSTPQLATSVTHFGADLGFMITASHNPPSDNAIKVFGKHGGQVRPPDELQIAERMVNITEIARLPFGIAMQSGKITNCAAETDQVYQSAVLRCRPDAGMGPRDVRILYSSLQGVGGTSVLPILRADQFRSLRIYRPHEIPDPNFSQMPGRMANPEQPEVFQDLIIEAKRHPVDVILASDPDADRIGCIVPSRGNDDDFTFLTGHQIGALLADYCLRKRRDRKQSTRRDYIIRTIVTTPLLDAIASDYGAVCHHNVLTGFKWIGGLVDDLGVEGFVMGCEEAHGYLVGNHIRDKDAGSASVAIAEFAAELHAKGETLKDALNHLYRRHGYFRERAFSLSLPGADGLATMKGIMDRIRTWPQMQKESTPRRSAFPLQLGGYAIVSLTDYLVGSRFYRDGRSEANPAIYPGNVLWLELDRSGFAVAIRPSGTEPKIKFYLFGHAPVRPNEDLDEVRRSLDRQLDAVEADLRHSLVVPSQVG
jgi:phosphomannomutase